MADGYWEDVGTTAAYLSAHQDILDGKVAVDIGGLRAAPGRVAGQGLNRGPAARIDGPAFIGENCTIEHHALLAPYTTIGANTQRGRVGGDRAVRDRRELATWAGGSGRGRRARTGPATCAEVPAASRGRWWARVASSAPTPRCGPT